LHKEAAVVVLGLPHWWNKNIKIFDRATTALVHCFLLERAPFEEVGLMVLFLWC
jgi:hypothetical protein